MTEHGNSRTSYFAELIKHLMGPVADCYDDPGVREIMINSPDEIYVENEDGMNRVYDGDKEARFDDAAALESLARAILQYSGKVLTAYEASQEARLPNKSRVHIVLHPAATKGLSITIRRFGNRQFKLADYTKSEGSLTEDAADFLRTQVRDHKNIIISGATSAGKTVLLNALAREIPRHERLITIEDVPEIHLPGNRNVVNLEVQMPDAKGRGGISMSQLFKAALRMRPDRVLVGECRGSEALDMLQAMNSGHAGSLSTVHADTPARALSRLETLCLLDARDIPVFAIRRQLLEAIDLIIQVQRIHCINPDGKLRPRRVVTHISELQKDAGRDTGLAYEEVVHDVYRLVDNTHDSKIVTI